MAAIESPAFVPITLLKPRFRTDNVECNEQCCFESGNRTIHPGAERTYSEQARLRAAPKGKV